MTDEFTTDFPIVWKENDFSFSQQTPLFHKHDKNIDGDNANSFHFSHSQNKFQVNSVNSKSFMKKKKNNPTLQKDMYEKGI